MEVNKTAVSNLIRNTEGEVRRIQESDEYMLNEDTLRGLLKDKVNDATIKAIMEELEQLEERDGISRDYFEEQFTSHMDLLGQGVYPKKLIEAIKFVSLVQSGLTNQKAYDAVFPQKAAQVYGRGSNTSSFATEYAKKKTVVEIMKRSIIRDDIRHAPLRDKILHKMIDLMNGKGAKPDDYVSPTVQLNAAIAAETMTRPPEDKAIDLRIGYNEDAKALQQTIATQLAENAALMRKQFESGRSLKDVQKIGIILDAEVHE